ncbi:MAG: restriction endonuclease subunit S [Desulfuromonadales bacterium]
MKYPFLPISSFCSTGSGGTPSRANVADYYGGTIPWVKSGELREDVILDTEEKITELAIKESSAKLVPKGALLIAMYGATIGRIAELGVEGTTNQAVCHIVPDVKIADKRYLFYGLQFRVPELIAQGAGGAQPNINQQIIRDTQIPLPPLPDQKRIAAILDKADSIRRKRQEAVRLTEELLRSVFLDMFGDPVTNPKGWEVVTVRDLVTEVKYGTSDKASYEGKYPILRMNNITYLGGWNFTDLKRIDIPEKELSKYLVRKGDILFNRTNSKELVGKTAVYRRDDPMAYAGYLIRIRPNKQNNGEYIAAYLNSTHGKTILESMCKSIVGMANINAQELQEIAIMQPSLELQNQYAALVYAVEKAKVKLMASSEATDTLYDSLLQRAFKGEL